MRAVILKVGRGWIVADVALLENFELPVSDTLGVIGVFYMPDESGSFLLEDEKESVQ